jgi:hypothetical protein
MNRFKLGEPLDSVVRKHLLTLTKPLNDDDIEIAIHKGWTARDSEIEQLKAENTCYREALKSIGYNEEMLNNLLALENKI